MVWNAAILLQRTWSGYGAVGLRILPPCCGRLLALAEGLAQFTDKGGKPIPLGGVDRLLTIPDAIVGIDQLSRDRGEVWRAPASQHLKCRDVRHFLRRLFLPP